MIYIVLIIFLIIFIIKLITVESFENLEHLTLQSDEAIQNLASLYNKDKLTIGNLNVTGDISGNIPVLTSANANIANLNATTGTVTNLKTDKLMLGNKWLLSGVGDGYTNDDWLRFLKTDGSSGYYGGIATGKLWVQADINGKNTFNGDVGGALNTLNDKANNLERARDNVRCIDGYDLISSFRASSVDDCAKQCREKLPNALCAQYAKNNGECWCKSVLGLSGYDGNAQAKLLF